MKKSQKNYQKNYKKRPIKNKCIVEDNEKYQPTNQAINSDEERSNEISNEENEEIENSPSDNEIQSNELMKKEDFNLKLFMLVNKNNIELWSM
jgi:hypothetical protein